LGLLPGLRKKTGPVNQGVIEGPGELLIRTFADLRRLSVPACAKPGTKILKFKDQYANPTLLATVTINHNGLSLSTDFYQV
jgi:hypothetical protein